MFPHLTEVLGEPVELLVKRAGTLGDLHMVAGDALVLPDTMDRTQRGHQRAVGHHHHLPVIGFLEDLRPFAQGEQEGGFDGNEHQHEVHALNTVQLGVILLTQSLRMRTKTFDMLLQQAATFGFVGVRGEALIVQQ